jgi:hypothetical protein
MTEPRGPDPAAAQDARNAERIAALDARLGRLAAKVTALATAAEAVRSTLADQADTVSSVDALKDTVAELASRLADLYPDGSSGGAFYTPIPTPRFWQLDGRDREQAVSRLRAWVRDVYAPTFGHLAARLPVCWEQHTFCLTVLDVASELHSVLYLQATRNQGLLAGQAELLTRLMPALAGLMAAEAARCPHTPARRAPANGTAVLGPAYPVSLAGGEEG